MLQQSLIISLSVMAIWAVFQEGMIFGIIQTWFAPLNNNLKKILYDCPVCMIPYSGSVIYCLLFHVSIQDWIITIVVAMGMSTIFVKLFRN
jgi:hypothetical protein